MADRLTNIICYNSNKEKILLKGNRIDDNRYIFRVLLEDFFCYAFAATRWDWIDKDDLNSKFMFIF